MGCVGAFFFPKMYLFPAVEVLLVVDYLEGDLPIKAFLLFLSHPCLFLISSFRSLIFLICSSYPTACVAWFPIIVLAIISFVDLFILGY